MMASIHKQRCIVCGNEFTFGSYICCDEAESSVVDFYSNKCENCGINFSDEQELDLCPDCEDDVYA
jgi:hypothetical protein